MGSNYNTFAYKIELDITGPDEHLKENGSGLLIVKLSPPALSV